MQTQSGVSTSSILLAATLPALSAAVAFALVVSPKWLPLVLVGIVSVAVLVQRTRHASVSLFILALPLLRPNILGQQLALEGAALMFAAAFLAILADGGRLRILERRNRPLVVLCVFLALVYAWLIFRSAYLDLRPSPRVEIQGLPLVVGVTIAASFVLSDRDRGVVAAKYFVVLIVASSTSYLITACGWAVFGSSFGRIFAFSAGGFVHEVFFPFTPTSGVQSLFGVSLHRFSGIGREPGWMSMYAAFAFFFAPRVGLGRVWIRVILLVGVLGCVSTAGFGVLVLVWAFETFLRSRDGGSALSTYLRQIFGFVVMAAAGWVAVNAPILGLAAKSSINEASVADRQIATQRGIDAITATPFGGTLVGLNAGINLIASIAAVGLPFVVLVLATLALPRVFHERRVLTTAPIAVIVLTLLTSQPAQDSTWIFILAAVTYAGVGADRNSDHVSSSEPTATLR